MRLIDADALRADYFVTSTTTNTPLYRYVSMEQIANAPTVEPASPWHWGDTEFMAHIIAEICNYAVTNGMEPNDTLGTVADNILALLKISTFNNWKPKEDA